MKKAFLPLSLVSVLLLSACASSTLVRYRPAHSGSLHLFADSEPVSLSCDADKAAKLEPSLREAAKSNFIYAIHAANAYDTASRIPVPGWRLAERVTAANGMSADIVERTGPDGGVVEVVVAFRGTELKLSDWLFANLEIGEGGGQYASARDLIERFLGPDTAYAKIKRVVTGHSLGGGLALHVSARFANLSAVVFDTSSRVFAPPRADVEHNQRVSIREKGEVLSFLDNIWPGSIGRVLTEPDFVYDFQHEGPIRDHRMYPLARGLTLVAASEGNKQAREVLGEVARCKFDGATAALRDPLKR